MSERTYMGGTPEDPRGRREGDSEDDSFRVTPPRWVKDGVVEVFKAIGKFGSNWILVIILLWGGYTFLTRVMARYEAREDKFIGALETLGDVKDALKEHMSATQKTQLFISTMCAGLAKQSDTSAQRREQEKACYNEYYAQELKEKTLSR